MKTLIWICCLIFSTVFSTVAHAGGCTGDYVADKDKSGDFDPKQVSARDLVTAAVNCGLKNVARNGWTQLSQLTLDQVRARLDEIDMKYVDEIPADKLPPDQRQRKSGCYHIVENGHWSIYMVPDQLRQHHMGENYLLAFHELVSTISPVADREYALSLEYEMKMIKKNTDELNTLGLSPIIFPPVPGLDTGTTGIIISGGGDLDTIWIKRQLRNFVFDNLVPEYVRTQDQALQTQLEQLVTTLTTCPIEADHTQPAPHSYVFDDVGEPPRLIVSLSYLQRQAGVKKLISEFQSRAPLWSQRCLTH